MLKKDRQKRKTRIRAKIFGTVVRPRISVFRSNKFIYAQAVDDQNQVTLASSSHKSLEKETKVSKKDISSLVGAALAEKLSKKKIKSVVFDRSGYKYHGRIQSLANAMRDKGIEF